MKILRIIARLNVGGPARHVAWLTTGLEPFGYQTTLATGVVPDGESDLSREVVRQGVEPLAVSQMSREILPRDLLTVFRLLQLMWQLKPDVIHTHTAKAGTVGRVAGFVYKWIALSAILGRPRSCKLVHTYHGHIFHSYYGAWKTFIFLCIERVLARVASDALVVISSQQRKEIQETFRVGRLKQYAIIPLGLDLAPFSDSERHRDNSRQELGIRSGEFAVGIVGRLTEIKNHELFLKAASLALRNALKLSSAHLLRFLIIGDGHLRNQLERKVDQRGLTENFIFTGNLERPERFYSALDAVALTSLNEGTPLSMLEAMAAGRPVVGTVVGGVSDLLGDVNTVEEDGYEIRERGIGVATKDAAGMAAAILRLSADVKLRQALARTGKEFVIKNYSKQRLLEDMNRLYKRITHPELINHSDHRGGPRRALKRPELAHGAVVN